MTDQCWKVDLQEIHDVLINVAKEAGTMITDAKPDAAGVGCKKNCRFPQIFSLFLSYFPPGQAFTPTHS
jgi:hypothetical protein